MKILLNVVLNTVHSDIIDDTLLTDINKDNNIRLSEFVMVLSETCVSEYKVHATLNMKP